MHLKSHWKESSYCDGLFKKANILIRRKHVPRLHDKYFVNMAAILWLQPNIVTENFKLVSKAHLVFKCVFLCYFSSSLLDIFDFLETKILCQYY